MKEVFHVHDPPLLKRKYDNKVSCLKNNTDEQMNI
jgi:hypothetical protein